jgi:acyl dehydratase
MELNGPAFVREVQHPMSTTMMLAALLPQAARKRQGVLAKTIVPGPMKVKQQGLRFEAAHVEAYRRVCEYAAQPGSVPITYPEMHFTPLIAEAVVSSRFPLSPLGLIHTAQEIELHERLQPGDEVDATTELLALRDTPRGYELDFSMLVERNGRKAWSGVATLLSRSSAARSGATRKRHSASEPLAKGFDITVSGDTGLRYARVSGDYNPHHLWWFTARPLGYRRPIAHGMWTFARVLSEVLEGVEEDAPLRVIAAFKRPLLMPSRIRIEAQRLTPDLAEVPFAAREEESGAPHVIGSASYSA